MTTWDEQIPFRQDSDDAAPHIVEMMGAVDVDLDADAVPQASGLPLTPPTRP